jgi:hypothetical protein
MSGAVCRLVTLPGFTPAELEVVVILLLPLAFGCLVIGLAGGTCSQDKRYDKQIKQTFSHGMTVSGEYLKTVR